MHRSQNKEPLNSIRFRRRNQLFENIWLESPPWMDRSRFILQVVVCCHSLLIVVIIIGSHICVLTTSLVFLGEAVVSATAIKGPVDSHRSSGGRKHRSGHQIRRHQIRPDGRCDLHTDGFQDANRKTKDVDFLDFELKMRCTRQYRERNNTSISKILKLQLQSSIPKTSFGFWFPQKWGWGNWKSMDLPGKNSGIN